MAAVAAAAPSVALPGAAVPLAEAGRPEGQAAHLAKVSQVKWPLKQAPWLLDGVPAYSGEQGRNGGPDLTFSGRWNTGGTRTPAGEAADVF